MKNLEKRIWISQTHTIGQWINESIKNHSKKTAIVDGRTHITYTDLGIQVNHYSSYFLQKGIRKGNKVVIQLNNTKEYVFSILALIQIGAIPVLTNYALRDKEVTGIIERSEAIAYVYSKEILGYSYKSMAERIKKRNRELLFIISVAEIEMSSFSDKNIILETPEVKDIAILMLSGGTTGTPKIVPLSHEMIYWHIKCYIDKFGFDEDSVYLGILPFTHKFALYSPGLLNSLFVGGTVVMCKTSSYDEIFPLIEREKVTITGIVPSLARMWLEVLSWDNSFNLSSLKRIIIGGALVEKRLIKEMVKQFPCDIHIGYGATEGIIMYNAFNRIHDVMENLKGLLTDNGSMVILEETRTSYILLTSMEFKDGLTGFTDERAENEQTFFTRNQWESVFASHKGEIVFEFPSNESKLDLSGQTIYVTRFVNELEPIRKHDVRMYLEEQVSPYMVPANILVIPEIPLTSNRKVDTKAVKNYFMGIEETNKKGGTELPQTDLEKRIADIWCKELNISNIGRNDSFYLVGGDSLLIAQVIGKMLEKIPEAEGWEWSALLTEMMQTPTIKGIAEKIEAFQKDTDYVIDPCLVQLKKSVKENSQSVAKVLFHAGTGTLTPYNALLSYIEKDSKENEAIIGFTFGDDADYISMETSQTFRLLGEKYGKILNKLGYSNYILIGHCVGGLIALETAQYLQKKNVQVSDVTLISSNIPKQKNQTILSQATDEIYRKTLQSSLDNEILLERIFAKLIGADAYKAGYQVDEERLQQYIEYIVDQGTGDITVEALCNTGGKFEDVAKEFRLLASKSVSERLNALYNIIERPNGELMEHQLKMLNILFRVFSQNFRCVSTYEPKPYYGNMRILCCEIQGGHFYPGFFAEDYETWKPYAKGNLTFDLIKGWHLDCITEPNLGENIKKMLDFNY